MKATETLAAIGLLTLCCLTMSGKTNVRRKVVDEGGSGPYNAEAREEKTFPDAVIYKPVDLKAAVAAVFRYWCSQTADATTLPCLTREC